VIVAEGLTKRFGPVTAVDDVSFVVPPGRVVGFLGHNGAGKTTTLRMLLGLVLPSAGSSTVLGRPFTALDHPLRRVGVLLEPGGHPGRTARQHLQVAAATAGVARGRADFLLELVGLQTAADRRVGGFSQGMRQRLGIATALLADPEAVVLDEPATGLDPDGIRWLRRLLRRLADEGRTVLVSSHQLAEMSQTADDVLVMDRGRLLAQQPVEELVGSETELEVATPAAEVLALRLSEKGVTARAVTPREVRVRNAAPALVSQLAVSAGLPLHQITAHEPSLEEAFFALTNRAPANGSNGHNGHNGATATAAEPAADDDGEPHRREPLADAEAAVDARLGELEAARPESIAVLAGEPALGRTTVALVLGDALARHGGRTVLVAALTSDRGRLRASAPPAKRSRLHLGHLLDDLGGFDDAARATPYVSMMSERLHLLAGPETRTDLAALTPERLRRMLAFVHRTYDTVVLDVGEGPPALARALAREAGAVVVVGAPEASGDVLPPSEVLELVERERATPATLLVNQADPDAVQRLLADTPASSGLAVLPHDRELIRALDGSEYDLDRLGATTRVAIKRLTAAVLEASA